ncbi:PVC-type heme-binding CxxCH protein [Mucilaginibacter ximonensis]|uniref:PVC-type heme-binding CxxCH protein n=1 Tax=Mucilaginibacter ximonensis TaxID=538021 RepID=A0ABW5YCT1_9SPHI
MKKYAYILLLLGAVIGLYQCTAHKMLATSPNNPPKADPNSSPVVPASESISKMKLEPGMAIKLIASEPLISTPVAMTFDRYNRIWVIEMEDYMPDTTGKGENEPLGKVVLLSDKNKDGVYDDRKIIIDSLVMPRALCLIEDGILVAEPPRLYYYQLKNDKVVKRTLVDAKYTDGGNVEHQPNGLYRALDNWIYNANSPKRYRKQGEKWLIEPAHEKGQWGITQDDEGRMYANDNSTNLQGDYFPPSLGLTNKNQRGLAGFNERTVADNRTFPIRPTTGVNRGYMKGVLDDSLRLVNFTAACGPMIYRGGLFGPDYQMNAFVAEPAGNLIKRDILAEKGNLVKGREAYLHREFLASVDERFRPVSLYNGPDGALYVIDMYRGIIQHKTYLTPYLAGEIGKRNLTKPLSCGRLYKIYPAGKKLINVTFPDDPVKLVALLGNANGYVRDEAQRILVDTKPQQALPALREALKSGNPLLVTHALWTLEGFGELKADQVLALLQSADWKIRMQALTVAPNIINNDNYSRFTPVLSQLVAANDTTEAPYVGFVTASLQKYDRKAGDAILFSLAKKYPKNNYVADAIVSNVQGREEAFQKEMLKVVPDTALAINKRIGRVVAAIEDSKLNSDPALMAKYYPRGVAIFGTVCKTCHGEDGNGVTALAPPLNKSEIVNGDKTVMISILLKGLTGPVKINGHVYKAPEISGEMPGFADNKDFSDDDLAQVMNFVRRSWQNKGSKINAADVKALRAKLASRQKNFTIDELQQPATQNPNIKTN